VLAGGSEQQVGNGDRDGEQDGRGVPPGRAGDGTGGYQDGADRDAGERDEGQNQVDDAAAVLERALGVVGEEREQAGADRPGDEQGQAAAVAAIRAGLSVNPNWLICGCSLTATQLPVSAGKR